MTEEQKKTPRPSSSLSNRSNLENRTDFQKQLDTLARLLIDNSGEEWDMCIGICLHDDGNGNKLYIASNQENPISAKEYMKNLQEFAKTKSLESYENLLNSAVKQTYCIKKNEAEKNAKKGNRNRSSSNASDRGNNEENLISFQEIVEDYYENKIILKKKPSWERLPEVASKLLEEVVDEAGKGKSKKWQYLTPWYDVGEMAIKVENGELETEITEVIKKENGVELVGSPRELTEEEKKNKKKFHAEVKIIDKLCRGDTETEEELPKDKYIGLSKPSCASCWATIKILNEEAAAKYKWDTCGTHGSDEYKPLMSTLIENKGKIEKVNKRAKEIKGEENKKGDKPKETSSELPNQETKLFNPIELLEKLQLEELQAQIEVSSKTKTGLSFWNLLKK